MNSQRTISRDVNLSELIAAAQRGDDAAFVGLVVRSQRLAVGLALGWLGDPDLAREAAREAFLDAHRDLGDLSGPDVFVSWLGRLVAQQCERLAHRASTPAGAASSDAEAAADGRRGTAALEHRDEARAAWAALERLSPRVRVVVTLQHLGGYGPTAIAGFLGLPVTTVKKRKYDARLRIRRELAVVQTTLKAEGTTRLETFSHQVESSLAVRRGRAAAIE